MYPWLWGVYHFGMNNKFPGLEIETSAAFGADGSSKQCASVCAPVVGSFWHFSGTLSSGDDQSRALFRRRHAEWRLVWVEMLSAEFTAWFELFFEASTPRKRESTTKGMSSCAARSRSTFQKVFYISHVCGKKETFRVICRVGEVKFEWEFWTFLTTFREFCWNKRLFR